jgi:hypothetical protein
MTADSRYVRCIACFGAIMPTTDNHAVPAVNALHGNWDRNRVFFQADAVELEMMLASAGEDLTVLGQVLAEDGRLFPPLTVRLIHGGVLRTAVTNYIGEFTFSPVETSSFVIELELPDGRVAGGFHVE